MIYPQKDFPLLEEVSKVFPINKYTIFTYGENYYTNYNLTPDLLEHEKTHTIQQLQLSPELWWRMYLDDPKFRLAQELQAYKHQIRSINDREKRFRVTLKCIEDVCSDLYGNIITKSEARRILLS